MATRLVAFIAAAVAYLAIVGAACAFASRPLETFVFYVFAAVMVASSLGVVLSGNIVRSATWLLGTLGAAAGLYLLLSANFLAAIQLIVYVGGILILLVFGIMLTAKNPALRFNPRGREVLLAAAVGLVLFGGMATLLLARPWPALPGEGPGGAPATVARLGEALLTTYLLPFELISVLLLAVMIGAAYLARPEKR